MDVVVQRCLGIRREAWQQLLDDVLVLNLLVGLEHSEPAVQVVQKGLHLQRVREVSAMELGGVVVFDS